MIRGSGTLRRPFPAEVGPPPPPPPPPPVSSNRVYAQPTLTNPVTITVPSGSTSVTLPAGQDCIVDFQWIERKSSILIYGSGTQKAICKNYWAYIDKAVTNGAYGRGGPRVRSTDGIGPAEVYFDKLLVQGPTLADAVATDAGVNTIMTIANARLDCSRQITGVSFSEPNEHIDQIQQQGKVKEWRLSNCTIYMSSTTAPIDPGKGLMLHKETGAAFTVNQKFVNYVAVGRTGAVVFQNTTDIVVNHGEGVYADASGVTNSYVWASNSPLFFPNNWTSSGTAPNRVASFGTNITGNVLEGRPTGGDYVVDPRLLP